MTLIKREDAKRAVLDELTNDVVLKEIREKPLVTIPMTVVKALNSLPSADAVDVAHDIPEYCSWSQTYTNMVQSAMSKASAEAEDRLYIKIYADDEPSVKAEKLYQICDETQNREVTEWLKEYFPSAEAEWIPCSERSPEELEAVNITWVNHNPPPYYNYTKDVPLVDSAVYYRGKWYWWGSTIIDVLAEYGEESGVEQIDKDIEVVAWMPLPEPYKAESEEV